MNIKISVVLALIVSAVFPVVAQAKIEFTEVMYDPAGTDTGREWIEIHNTGSAPVDVSAMKLSEEGVQHVLKASALGSVSTGLLDAGQYGVIADDPAKFLVDWSTYSGPLFDSSFSLKNTGEPIVLRSKDFDEDSLVFDPTIGAAGDGNSLQRQISAEGVMTWVVAVPTPGGGLSVADVSSTNGTSGTSSTTDSPPPSATPAAETSSPVQVSAEMATPVVTKSIPVEPQIFCKISGKSEVFAGVETAFSAQGLGLKKQPLQNARYVWNFGDGQTKEGQYVLHTYTQPGTYDVFLAAASDVYSASDRLKVTVRSPQLSVAHSQEVLTILNQDTSSIDLFGLKLHQDGRNDFLFPEHSTLSGRAEMNIDTSLFSMAHADVSRAKELPITLQYLNGRVVATSSEREISPTASETVAKVVPPKETKTVTKSTRAVAKVVAKPKVADNASQTIDLTASSSEGQIIALDTTAKERRLNYYGATIGVLILLAFAWWYLLR